MHRLRQARQRSRPTDGIAVVIVPRKQHQRCAAVLLGKGGHCAEREVFIQNGNDKVGLYFLNECPQVAVFPRRDLPEDITGDIFELGGIALGDRLQLHGMLVEYTVTRRDALADAVAAKNVARQLRLRNAKSGNYLFVGRTAAGEKAVKLCIRKLTEQIEKGVAAADIVGDGAAGNK